MTTPRVRMTTVIMDILDVLTNTPAENPPWGLTICEMIGRGTGTVYPALERMLKVRWVTAWWEDPPPPDRPARRFYEITSAGRQAYAAELHAREVRRAARSGLQVQAGDA